MDLRISVNRSSKYFVVIRFNYNFQTMSAPWMSITLLLFIQLAVETVSECPEDGVVLGSACYIFSYNALPFASALTACKQHDADLLWLLNEGEYRWISAYLYDTYMETTEWITSFYDFGGHSDPYHYLWKNDEPAYFVHWAEYEPNEVRNRCAVIRNDNKELMTMYDASCTLAYKFICKIGNGSFAYNGTSVFNTSDIVFPEDTAKQDYEEFILEIKKDPDERESAQNVGRATLIIMVLELLIIVLMDLISLSKDIKYLKNSLKKAWWVKKHKKPKNNFKEDYSDVDQAPGASSNIEDIEVRFQNDIPHVGNNVHLQKNYWKYEATGEEELDELKYLNLNCAMKEFLAKKGDPGSGVELRERERLGSGKDFGVKRWSQNNGCYVEMHDGCEDTSGQRKHRKCLSDEQLERDTEDEIQYPPPDYD